LSESSAYQLADVKASAVDAGIPETFVQQALREHGLIGVPGRAIVAAAPDAAVAPRRTGALPAVVVKDGPKQPVNVFLGTATRIVVEATVDGEMPERDYDLVLDLIRREMNPGLVLTGMVITMHDDRTRLAQDVERELRGHFSDLVLRTVIPRNIRVAEAPSFGVPVVEHAPTSQGSVAYRELAAELAERERADLVSVDRRRVDESQVEVEG